MEAIQFSVHYLRKLNLSKPLPFQCEELIFYAQKNDEKLLLSWKLMKKYWNKTAEFSTKQ
ncbi:CLUMA_CG002310, isoform A [Clunio marinus]|uniref:CLUMA_CG002310, isoform A n=1 Tax=Clunio marinus TaxID=568069 RepID=A0A1J1HK89_9DIPT|nr:CLUMA_CG002310, isoform A [Clunio marinus]